MVCAWPSVVRLRTISRCWLRSTSASHPQPGREPDVYDATDAFAAARSRGSWPMHALVEAVATDPALQGMRVEWDEDAGEEWLRILKTSMVLGLVWVPGPLVVATSGHHEIVDEVERLTATTVEQIAVPHLDSPVLCLQPDRLTDIWPGREWPRDAIDPACLSAHDLWHATGYPPPGPRCACVRPDVYGVVMADTRTHDLVVYGATGFVGRLTAAYLAEHAPDGARIALAGRSRERLEEVRNRLGGRAVAWPVLVADSFDRAALDEIARSARTVATTVGPYATYGLPLVGACAEAGTHYADLTGEVLFIRESAERFTEPARGSGARIVHSCGFDSIPSDLGVQILHDRVRADGEGELEDTTFVLTGVKGGISGGTLASLQDQIDALRRNPEMRKIVADPYSLSPARDKEPDLGKERDMHGPVREDELGGWMAPFVMASFNTRVVRRSNALQDWAYGRRLRYRELMRTGPGPVGLAKAAGITG